MSDHPDLFSEENIKRMVHREPLSTEVDAARAIGRRLNAMHQACLEAFKAHGAMTDEELEQLPQFRDYGPSTARKRRSELYQWGQLMLVGERANKRGRQMKVWDIKK